MGTQRLKNKQAEFTLKAKCEPRSTCKQRPYFSLFRDHYVSLDEYDAAVAKTQGKQGNRSSKYPELKNYKVYFNEQGTPDFSKVQTCANCAPKNFAVGANGGTYEIRYSDKSNQTAARTKDKIAAEDIYDHNNPGKPLPERHRMHHLSVDPATGIGKIQYVPERLHQAFGHYGAFEAYRLALGYKN